MSRPLIPPEWTPEIVASMATPVADMMRRRRVPVSDSCPFPVIVDANVPDPEMVYELVSQEIRVEVDRVVLMRTVRPVMKLEGV